MGQDPYWGIIFKPKSAVPTYHRPGYMGDNKVFTHCGRPCQWSSTKPWLPLVHCKRFARACKGCFPR